MKWLTNQRFKLYLPFIIILLFYALTLKGQVGNLHPLGTGNQAIKANTPPFETSMERGRYAQTVSLAEGGDYDVTEFRQFLKPDIAWYNNRFLSTFPPGVATLAVPFYLIGKLIGLSQLFTFTVSTLFSFLTAYLIYLTCKKLKLSMQTAVFASVVYALGSVAWPYSVSFSAHPVSAFICILGAYLLLDIFLQSKTSKRNLFSIGLLAGANFIVDYPNILIFAPVVVCAAFYKLIKLNQNQDFFIVEQHFLAKLPFVLGFALALIPFIIFNVVHYNKPIAFTNTYTIKFLETQGINFENVKLSNNIFDEHKYQNRFSAKQAFLGIQTLLVRSDRGLLQYSPVYILAFVGVLLALKQWKLWAGIVSCMFLLNLLIYGSYDDAWGGWAFGPRYLIVTLPILAVFCGIAFEKSIEKWPSIAKGLALMLLIISSAIALLGALTTNAVPPSIEVVNTNISSNYVSNWKYLHTNGVSSFFYSILPGSIISPLLYFYILLGGLVVFEYFIVFKYRGINGNKNESI